MNKYKICSFWAILSLCLFSLCSCSNQAAVSISGRAGDHSASVASATIALSALTGNNTAACPAAGVLPAWCQHPFTGQSDSRSGIVTSQFDPPAGNVSDEDIHSYLGQSGSEAKIFANFMLGYCTSTSSAYCHNNVQTGYTADDENTIAAQAADLQRRHIDGAIMSWDGDGTSQDEATLLFQSWANLNACSGSQGCTLTYLIMYNAASLDYNVASTGIPGTSGQSCSGLTGQTYETCAVAHLRNDLCYINGAHWGNAAYQRANGRPILEVFPDETILPATGPAPSWTDVWMQIGDWTNDLPQHCAIAPFNSDHGVPLIVFENRAGFTHEASSGSFYWVNPAGTDLATDQFTYNISQASDSGTLDSFLKSAITFNGELAFSGAFKGFNSIQATWGTGRIMDQQCGQTWMDSLTEGNKYYIGGVPYLQIATWNDYNEGTEIESGIDNCYTISAETSGSSLNWELNPSSAAASLLTVSHIEIYDSPDGTNLTLVATQPAAMGGSWSLAGLTSGTHTLYVRMVGKNSILNQISPAILYKKLAAKSDPAAIIPCRPIQSGRPTRILCPLL
jgi:hypothetical protein